MREKRHNVKVNVNDQRLHDISLRTHVPHCGPPGHAVADADADADAVSCVWAPAGPAACGREKVEASPAAARPSSQGGCGAEPLAARTGSAALEGPRCFEK